MERTKDKFINTKATRKGVTKTGKESLQISFKQEDVVALIEELTKTVDNPRGAKLSIYTGKKEYNGRTFDSTSVVVTGLQEFGAGSGAGGGASRQFVSKKTGTTIDPSVEEKIKKLKG